MKQQTSECSHTRYSKMGEKEITMKDFIKDNMKIVLLVLFSALLVGATVGGTFYGVTKINAEKNEKEPATTKVKIITDPKKGKNFIIGKNGKKFRPKKKRKQKISTQTKSPMTSSKSTSKISGNTSSTTGSTITTVSNSINIQNMTKNTTRTTAPRTNSTAAATTKTHTSTTKTIKTTTTTTRSTTTSTTAVKTTSSTCPCKIEKVMWDDVCVNDTLKTNDFIIGEWKPEVKSKYSRLATLAEAKATENIWRQGWHYWGLAGLNGYKATSQGYGYTYKIRDSWKTNDKPLCNHKYISTLLVCLTC